jgi:hypothetical protein
MADPTQEAVARLADMLLSPGSTRSLRAYALRGRYLARQSRRGLNWLFVETTREFVDRPAEATTSQAFEDAKCEFLLREEQPPFHLVQEECVLLCEIAAAAHADLEPDRVRSVAEHVIASRVDPGSSPDAGRQAEPDR